LRIEIALPRRTPTSMCDGGGDAMGRETWRAYDKASPSSLGEPVRSTSGGLGPCHLGVVLDGDRRAHRDSALPDHPAPSRETAAIVSMSAHVVGKRARMGGLLFHIVSIDDYVTLQLDAGKRRESR
jgi:hypothetical protein